MRRKNKSKTWHTVMELKELINVSERLDNDAWIIKPTTLHEAKRRSPTRPDRAEISKPYHLLKEFNGLLLPTVSTRQLPLVSISVTRSSTSMHATVHHQAACNVAQHTPGTLDRRCRRNRHR